MRRVLIALLLAFAAPLSAQQSQLSHNIILVTLDGFRWQELFTGADSTLIRGRFVRDTAATRKRFWAASTEQRRATLLPFFWEVIAKQGQLHGNRLRGSKVDVTNRHRFSYPGYNELLTGFVDARIDSNDKVPNPNRTVLEVLNALPAFRGKIAAFGSWDVFPYIINAERSGVFVNAGPGESRAERRSAHEAATDRLQTLMPLPWSGIRWDAFTYEYGFEHLQKMRPRVLYLAFDETDDFAHDGRYDAYLDAAQRTDRFLRELWNWVQSTPDYRNRTTLIVTSDHGRGSGDEWRNHGDDVIGAEAIWLAVLGPDTPATGEAAKAGQYYQIQIASTLARLLGVAYTNDRSVGAPIDAIIRN
jgi:Type I phosphodiesterase / nucleotide pyrophosphatase